MRGRNHRTVMFCRPEYFWIAELMFLSMFGAPTGAEVGFWWVWVWVCVCGKSPCVGVTVHCLLRLNRLRTMTQGGRSLIRSVENLISKVSITPYIYSHFMISRLNEVLLGS